MPSIATLRLMFPRAAEADIAALQDAEALMRKAGIMDDDMRLAMFLAQIDHESSGLARKVENLSYSAERMVEVWPSRFPNVAAAKPYARNPEALANKVYGGRMGNTRPGDGWRYRGRAGLMITGLDAYRTVERLTGLPLVRQPELAETPEGSIKASVGVWMWKGLGRLVGSADPVLAVTRALNGGTVGLQDRRTKFRLFLDLIRG